MGNERTFIWFLDDRFSSLRTLFIFCKLIELTETKTLELFTGSYRFSTIERYNEKKTRGAMSGIGLNMITCNDWYNRIYWGEQLPQETYFAIGHMVVCSKGTVEINDERYKREMVAGLVYGKSLDSIGNQELIRGNLTVIPMKIHTNPGSIPDRGKISGYPLPYILTLPGWNDLQYWSRMRLETPENMQFVECFAL